MTAIARSTTGLSRLAWAAGIAVGASLPHWASLPAWIPALLLAAVAWRFGARLWHWPLPGPWLRRSLTILVFAAVLIEFRTINGLTPGTGLLVVMIALKFLETRSRRDHLVLTFMAYFLVFASLLAGGGLIKGLYLLAFVWITTLGLLQVGREGPLLAFAPQAKLAGGLLLKAVPLMLVLFLLFPRLPGPLWSMPSASDSGTSGLSGSMSPGDITNLGLSDEIAFRVEFDGAPPAPSERYWRGPVLSSFDGRTWTQRRAWRGDPRETIEYFGAETEYEVKLEPTSRRWLFALDLPARWTGPGRRRPIRMTSDYQLRLVAEPRTTERLSYTVASHSEYRAMERLNQRQLESLKQLPPDLNPRTRALVADLIDEAPSTAVFIERALDVFRADGFAYTLTPPPLGRHTADDLIFETHEGFCEHYASAFAIMMRMAGLPARVVTGYQGGELNRYGGYYVVRQADAHAWTEVWTRDDGWIRIDPTAAVASSRISFGSAEVSAGAAAGTGSAVRRRSLLRQAALAFDAVNHYWNDWVIDYGPSLQRSLLERIGFDGLRWRGRLSLAGIAAAAAIALMTLYHAWRSGWLHSLGGGRPNDPPARDFERFTRRLEQLGVERLRAGETPSAYAARAARRVPSLTAEITAVTETYLAARYEPDERGRSRERLRRLVRAFAPRPVGP